MSSLEKLEALKLVTHAIEVNMGEQNEHVSAEAVIQALTSAGYTIERGWCDDMSLAPRDGTPFNVHRKILGRMTTHGMRWHDGNWVFLDSGEIIGPRIRYAMLASWRPITPPNGGE